MKTKTVVTEISHDDLVNLFSTALYGNLCLYADFSIEDYYSLKSRSEDDCFEDKLAKLLLSGKQIKLCDIYARGIVYGNLYWNYGRNADGTIDEDGEVQYSLNLDDIKNAIGKAIDSGSYIVEYISHWTNEDSYDLDLPEADAIIQWILFGKEIYG